MDSLERDLVHIKTFISIKKIHLQKSTYIFAVILMWSLCKHFCFFRQLNKTNPKYNYNPYNYAYIHHRNYRNTIFIYLIISSTIFTETKCKHVSVYTPLTVSTIKSSSYVRPIQSNVRTHVLLFMMSGWGVGTAPTFHYVAQPAWGTEIYYKNQH